MDLKMVRIVQLRVALKSHLTLMRKVELTYININTVVDAQVSFTSTSIALLLTN